jgi:hypothetical protein
VDERIVTPGTTHRRAGVHTEARADSGWGGGGWGRAGGLFLASNVPSSTIIYDLDVEPSADSSVAPELLERARYVIQPQHFLHWIHDRTPHASLPIPYSRRQFFRLVTSAVDLWFAAHSTPNPLGVVTPAKIVEGNKFS